MWLNFSILIDIQAARSHFHVLPLWFSALQICPSWMRCNNLQIKSPDSESYLWHSSNFSFGATVRRKLTVHNMVSNEKEKNARINKTRWIMQVKTWWEIFAQILIDKSRCRQRFLKHCKQASTRHIFHIFKAFINNVSRAVYSIYIRYFPQWLNCNVTIEVGNFGVIKTLQKNLNDIYLFTFG